MSSAVDLLFINWDIL